MGFIEASKSYLVRWLNFKDRASRSEYWWGYLFSIIFGLVLGFTWGLILGIGAAATGMLEEDSTAWTLLSLPPSLFVMIASLALSVRRLHDIDRSGWWVMIPLTIIGIFVLIYWFCKRGEEGENRFGADPLGSEPASTMEG